MHERILFEAVIPLLAISPKDAGLAVKWLEWYAMLGMRRTLVAFCSPGLTAIQQSRVVGAAERAGAAVVVASPASEKRTRYGYGYAANVMFREALEHIERTYPGQSMLWCEADTAPMTADWVERIHEEYIASGQPFMGDFHDGGEIPHMTGNAVYPANWRALAPSLAALPGPNAACGWDTQCAHETVPQMAIAKTIQQIWRPGAWTEDAVQNLIRPECALFHQDKTGTLIDVLCDRAGIARIPLVREDMEVDYAQAAGYRPQVQEVKSLKTEIMIVTFKRDMEFLRYCIRSIGMFCRGFTGTTLVVPSSERGLYDWAPPLTPLTIRYFDEAPSKGMLSHEVQVCRADEHCPEAEAILHLDADCIVWAPMSPSHYAPGGKPLLVRESYVECGKRNPNRLHWQVAVERAIGEKPEFETMTRHPNIHLREVYGRLRRNVEQFTGKAFDEYVLGCQNAFPQSFAEFPLAGHIALRDFAERYTVVDYDWAADQRKFHIDPRTAFQYVYAYPRDRCVEVWSHGGVDQYRSLLEQIMRGHRPGKVLK